MKNRLLLFFFLVSTLSFAQNVFYNIVDYGAKGDGTTNNTKAINSAINAASKNGGGTVYFPAGIYLTGTIIMQDDVILNLEAGSTILGSTNIEDYRVNLELISNNKQEDINGGLIFADNKENIGITGSGIIDGQGKSFYRKENRPVLLFFKNCKDVKIEGITLQHPASWTQHYLKCDGVTLRDIKIFAHGGENNDMVDINQTRNVVITGLRGDSDDDGITLKSTADGLVENVVISNCIIRSRTNAIKAGTESYGGFRNIAITNCTISPSTTNDGYSGYKEGMAGIALEIVDGGIMENITISNIVIEETTAPIFIRLGNRGRNYPSLGLKSKPIGSVNNINISNIIVSNASKIGCSIVGEIDNPITNVSLSNIKINFKGGGTLAESLEEKPELVNEYPECIRLGTLPAYGFFVRHVDGIIFRDVEFTYNREEHRLALIFNDVENIKLLNFDAQVSDDAFGQVVFQNSENIFVNGCAPKKMNNYLRFEQGSKDINIVGNNLQKVNTPIIVDETIKTSEIRIGQNLTNKESVYEFLKPNINRDSLGYVSIYFPDNADVYYTTDGSEPTRESKKYLTQFMQVTPVTIKAVAINKTGKSNIAKVKLNRLQVLTPKIIPINQFYYKSINVKLISGTDKALIYYTLDGSEPTKKSKKYDGDIVISQNAKLRVKAFKKDYSSSDEALSKYQMIVKKKGVQYKYYESKSKEKWEKLPDYLSMKPKLEGTISKFGFEGIEHRETFFGLVQHGFIKIKKSGEYNFYLGSNDGSKLFVDNNELINNDGNHGYTEKVGKIYFDKGEHLIEVRYYQAGGVKSLKVFWEGVGMGKHEISVEELN